MSANIVYKLAGSGVSVTFETEPKRVELTLDESYEPFNGTKQFSGGDLTEQSSDQGVQLTGTFRGQEPGRGGPIDITLVVDLFLPAAPPLSDSAEEKDTTGALVFYISAAYADPKYRAEALTGTVSLPAQGPGGRY